MESAARGVNQPALGDFNQRVVADAIRRAPGISRTELADTTGLAPQTISNVVRRLLAAELVKETGAVARGPGKPRTNLELDPDGAFAIGIHIDPSIVDIILMDLTGEIRARVDREVGDREDPQTTLAEVAAAITHLVSTADIPPSRVVGIGIASPGPVDVNQRLIINPPRMPRWHQIRIGDLLEEMLNLPVVLLKDVTAGAIGELWLRRFDEPGSFIFCYLGTGLGVASVLRGVVQLGVDGNAGEVGPRPSRDADMDSPSHVGTATAPATWVRQAVELGLHPAVPAGPVEPRQIASAVATLVGLAERGDPEVQKIFRDAGQVLGRTLAQYSDLFDIPTIVMGGPYWEVVGDLLLPEVSAALEELPVLADVRPVTARTCAHGRDVSAIGAASHALRQLLIPATRYPIT